MCDAGYKAQRFLVKRPHPLDSILDFVEGVDVFQEFPVTVVPVFKNLLDDVAPIFISRKRRPVGIPKPVFRKLAKIYVSATHRNEYTKFSGTWIYFPLNYHFHSFKNSFIF